MQIFNVEGPLFAFLNKMADLFVVNILFILCCIPVVTIGASCTAMYTVTLKMVHDKEGYLARSFFQAFKENFRQATTVWCIALFVLFISLADIRIFSTSGNEEYRLLLIGAFLLFFVTLLLLLFIFPLLAKFSNSLKQTVKNAFLMEARHLPFTLCILVISAVPPVITALLPQSMGFVYILWLLFGFSLTAYANSFFFEFKIFNHYISDED